MRTVLRIKRRSGRLFGRYLLALRVKSKHAYDTERERSNKQAMNGKIESLDLFSIGFLC